MKLYVLNPSRQKLTFNYRVSEQSGVRYMLIGPGQQEMVFEGKTDVVFDIIKQNEIYGLVEDTDAKSIRRGFTGMIFALDRPVDINAAKVVERQNQTALTERGKEMRKISAVAAADTVATKIMDAGFSQASLQDTTHSLRGEDENGQPVTVNEDTVVSKKSWKK